MFNREFFENFLGDIGDSNFCILTNIGRGHGINGVSYMDFRRKYELEDRYGNGTVIKKYDNNEIIEITDNYILIEKNTNESILRSDVVPTSLYYIPYEAILAVEVED